MAVNVDTVYQRVLALANKEQRGYITPQEFNLYANQAQMDIFEQYFYDLNQFRRIPGNDMHHSDMVDILEEKINLFHTNTILASVGNSFDLNSLGSAEEEFYRIMEVNYTTSVYGKVTVEKVEYSKYCKMIKSPLIKPNLQRPIYYLQGNSIFFYPESAYGVGTIDVHFIRKPNPVNWTYVVVGDKALLDKGATSGYRDFELHAAEETDLVIKILQLSGITLNDTNLYQIAGAEDIKNIQQEKQ